MTPGDPSTALSRFPGSSSSVCYRNSTPDAEVACVESKCHDAAIITGIQQVFLSEFHYDELCMFKLPEDGY